MTEKTIQFRLTRLRVKNFRSIGEIDIALKPLTVLIGLNGSGKSNIVDALRFLRDCFTRGLDQAILDRDGLIVLRRWTFGSKPADVFLEITMANERSKEICTYSFVITSHKKRGFIIKNENLMIKINEENLVELNISGNSIYMIKDGKKKIKKTGEIHSYSDSGRLIGPSSMFVFLRNFDEPANILRPFDLTWSSKYKAYADGIQEIIEKELFYVLNPKDLRAPQRLVQEFPFDEEGQNLSAVLQYLRRNKRISGEIKQVLNRLVEGVTDISVETTGSYLVTYLHYKNSLGAIRKSDLGQESDGTLRVLGILAAIFQQKLPEYYLPIQQFLAIEEPEVNVHPGVLAVLAEIFHEASLRSQIVLTTHSPDLLEFLPPESFIVVEKIDGETKAGELASDQAEIIRQRLFSPGELLRSEGLHRQSYSVDNTSSAV